MQPRFPLPNRPPNRSLKRTRGYVSAPWLGFPAAPLSSGVGLGRLIMLKPTHSIKTKSQSHLRLKARSTSPKSTPNRFAFTRDVIMIKKKFLLLVVGSIIAFAAYYPTALASSIVNVHPPLHRQRQEGQSLASTGDGSLQVFPVGMAAYRRQVSMTLANKAK